MSIEDEKMRNSTTATWIKWLLLLSSSLFYCMNAFQAAIVCALYESNLLEYGYPKWLRFASFISFHFFFFLCSFCYRLLCLHIYTHILNSYTMKDASNPNSSTIIIIFRYIKWLPVESCNVTHVNWIGYDIRQDLGWKKIEDHANGIHHNLLYMISCKNLPL